MEGKNPSRKKKNPGSEKICNRTQITPQRIFPLRLSNNSKNVPHKIFIRKQKTRNCNHFRSDGSGWRADFRFRIETRMPVARTAEVVACVLWLDSGRAHQPSGAPHRRDNLSNPRGKARLSVRRLPCQNEAHGHNPKVHWHVVC